MRTRHQKLRLPILLATLITCGLTGAVLATEWTVPLHLSNAADVGQEIAFGIHPDGTDGVDPDLGEVGLPPWPPSSIFDARFMIDGVEGLRLDIRDDGPDERLHRIEWQPGEGGYPIVLRWDRENLPPAIMTMTDGYTGNFIPPFDLSQADSLLIPPELSFIKKLNLYVTPDSILPTPPVIDPPVPDLQIFTGQQFPDIPLDDHVVDEDTPLEDLQWLVSGNNPPWISISEDRILSVEVPPDWSGSQLFNLRVVDPGGLEDSQDFLLSAVEGGLPSWSVPLTLENGAAELEHCFFGLHPDASDGIDPDLGEVALPPWPPAEIFNGRMLLPDGLTHSQRDLRLSAPGIVEYHIQWQAGEGGYPITVSWDEELPPGDFFIFDDIDGTFLPPLDMNTTQALVVPEELDFVTGLIISADPVVDVTPPLGPFDLRVIDWVPHVSVSLEWSPCVEDHFAYYEVLYDSLYFVSESNYVWDWSEDPALSIKETTTTTVALPELASGWTFRIRAWDAFGNPSALSRLVTVGMPVDAEPVDSTPAITLSQNYPNPFNPRVNLRLSLPKRQHLNFAVYDLSGRRVAVLHDGPAEPGERTFQWNGCDDEGKPLASGTYIFRAAGEEDVVTTKGILLK